MVSWKDPLDASQNEVAAVDEDDNVALALQSDAPLSQSILKKYIRFAKKSFKPEITNVDTDRVSDTYAEIRRLSDQSGGIPIAVRHIESIIRISEAHAKAHLRNMVTDEDMRFGIRMLLESFISSQKHAGDYNVSSCAVVGSTHGGDSLAAQRNLRRHFSRHLDLRGDSDELLLFALQALMREYTAARAAQV
jgi:DNA replication licensing factor MCM2